MFNSKLLPWHRATYRVDDAMPRRVSGRGYKHAAPPPLSHLTNTLPPTHPQAIQQSTPDYIITVTDSSYFSKYVLASNVLYVVLEVYFCTQI